MSGRRRQGLSPSLFPFLAVLVCTLGTLILLLALVAENSTAAAEQKARAELQAQAKDEVADAKATRMTRDSVESLLREEEFRVKELVAVRDQQTSDLESRRDELTHLDDHIGRLRQQLQRLNDEVREATGELETPAISDTLIAEIKDQIESEKKTVERLREESADLSPRVVIVPHKGPNGTDRRPVYLECKADGVTIWPEGSHISIEHLENSSYSANPLDAALRTIRMHVMQNYRDTVPPYPLLVVRPDGIDAYGAARRAMQDWDDQFGYELVPAEVKLAFSKPDANLKRRIEIAINTAAAEQRVRVAMSRRSLLNGGSYGNAVRGGSRPSNAGLPTLSAAALDRAGRANGFGQLRDEYRAPSPSSAVGSPYTQGPQIGSVSRNSYVGNVSDDAGAAARRMAEQMQTAAEEMRTGGPSSGSQEIDKVTGTDSLGMRSPIGKNFADLAPEPRGNHSQPSTESGQLYDGSSEDPSAFGQEPTQSSNAQGSAVTGSLSRESTSSDTNSNLANSPNAAANGSSNPAAPQQSQSMQQSQAMQLPPAMQQTIQGSPQMQGSPSLGSPVMMDENLANDPRMSTPMAPADPMESTTKPQLSTSTDLVRRQGRNWAIPDSMAGMHGNAIVRTIRMQCYPDRFVLLPAKNEGATEVFGIFNGNVERATLELATALRRRIEQWGPALPGGRWQPRLDVQIEPQGDMRFHQLRILMNDSGIELVGKESP